MDKILREKILNDTLFYEWFSQYSEKHHGLAGWIEYDQYLDEVELPFEIVNTLIQKWLRDKHNIIVEPRFGGIENNNKYAFDIVTHNIISNYNWISYDEAIDKGIEKGLSILNSTHKY